jgi:hypothetical protein
MALVIAHLRQQGRDSLQKFCSTFRYGVWTFLSTVDRTFFFSKCILEKFKDGICM